MSQDTAADELFESLKREIIKLHNVYDGSNRLIERYEAFANAVNGGPAIKTSYTYDGATERVVGMKEELSTWNSTWDI